MSWVRQSTTIAEWDSRKPLRIMGEVLLWSVVNKAGRRRALLDYGELRQR